MIKIPGRSSSASTCSPVLSEQYDEEFFAQHRVLLPAFRALADLLWNHMKTPQHPHPSILDVGCGHGFMVESLRQCGFTAYGIDGSSSATSLWPVQYLDCYQVGDLTQTKTLKQFPKTDCICSFETAEHLPERVSQRFVNALIQHQPQKVFFSAATAFQDLNNNPTHINEQPFSYWVRRFGRAQYELDVVSTVTMRNAMFAQWAVFEPAWWYPKNVLVFQPKTEASFSSDQAVARLVDVRLNWFPHPTVKEPFSLSVLRDRSEYHYLVMTAITASMLRLTKGAYAV